MNLSDLIKQSGLTGPTGPTGYTGYTGPMPTASINDQVDAYTLVLGDADKVVRISHADAKTLTIPKNNVVAFPVGTKIAVVQGGAGQITIAPVDGDVTLESYDSALKLVGQYAGALLIKRDTNTWIVEGNLEA